LHNVSFQVTSVNGIAQPYTTEQDTVPVPHEIDGRAGQVVIRVPFGQETGRFMFHCHIAAHEDKGMMSFIDVVNPRNPHDDTTVADRSWNFICHTPGALSWRESGFGVLKVAGDGDDAVESYREQQATQGVPVAGNGHVAAHLAHPPDGPHQSAQAS
jgi:hypothetical protein